MGVFKQFATNRKLERDGIRIEFAPNPDGTIPTMIVRRSNIASPFYQAIYERIIRPYKVQIDSKQLSNEDDEMLMQRICAEAAVVSWENWRMPNGVAGGRGEGDAAPLPGQYDRKIHGEPQTLYDFRIKNGSEFDLPFNVEAVCLVFNALPELWRKVTLVSADPDSYRAGDLEEIAKNS